LSCVAAQTLLQLAILRGLCGVFLSGVFPVATTLASEFLPTRLRARSLSLLIAGYVAGASGGGAVAAFLIGDYGWRGGFWLGGLLPLACVPIFLLALPESVQFRARRNPRDPMIARTLMRLAPGERFDGSDTFIAEAKEPSSAKPDLLRVLKEGRVIPTFLLWGAFFLAMGNGALVSSWLPTFFKVLDGISVQRFGHVLILGSIAAVGGTLLIGILLDRMRPTTVMMLCYLLDAAALFCVGLLSFGGPPFLFAFFVMYACMFAGTAGLMTISTSFYPPAIRATGFGWTIAAGRFGSIAGPLMGGAVLTAGLSLQQTVSLIAIPPLGVVLLLFLFRRFTVATQNSRIAG
jgi:AAHS family 4-hydroxybenzoate transporter-like MFS transporter